MSRCLFISYCCIHRYFYCVLFPFPLTPNQTYPSSSILPCPTSLFQLHQQLSTRRQATQFQNPPPACCGARDFLFPGFRPSRAPPSLLRYDDIAWLLVVSLARFRKRKSEIGRGAREISARKRLKRPAKTSAHPPGISWKNVKQHPGWADEDARFGWFVGVWGWGPGQITSKY
ncbi:uncharacterized protein EI97DRAFT_305981 [Westerdykella ornata]|uniref:Uncharacterized protein n=1 Tax=Westerdykella ornata TaxID=318751 RepID=A0A6A6JLB0_WESOR|nr:uncharacterized protein EI97DRAFT_305981 [Westerdykella ornata]KAF2277015.1 hypothetical protein EI97DRAFT_305981 [Westerdykella ornata]